jgi:hypothetical protein
MNYTWGDIQILAIKKMFLNNVPLLVSDLPNMRTDRKYQLYLNAMPEAANEGLLRLMSKGKPLIKKYTLTYDVPNDIFDYQSFDTMYVKDNDVIISGLASQSYYFEINNDAVIEIQKLDDEWTTIQTITHVATVEGSYEVYKGLIDNAQGKEVRIVFKTNEYLYCIRNVALYNVKFKTEDLIFNNTKKQRYDLKELIADFYTVMSVEYEKEERKGQYNSDYTLEEDGILIIDSKRKGNFIITYKAYPAKITLNTQDSYKFTIPSEMIAILPLYIVSQLYKDDDIAQATQYRNEFEIELENINILNEPMEFANNSNWL